MFKAVAGTPFAKISAKISIGLFLLLALSSDGRAAPRDSALYAASFTAIASDALFENSVRIRWTQAPPEGYIFHVRRDGELLSLAASTDSTYFDATGIPGVEYDYCVEVRNPETGGVLTSSCDPGSRIIFPPIQMAASDGHVAEGVELTWSDQSLIESGYRIYRQEAGAGPLVEIADLAANADAYVDAAADSGVVYEYCVAAVDADGYESTSVCDEGTRGYILPPLALEASDGQYTDRVLLTWTDGTDQEEELRVYRDGSQIATLPANATSYEDFGALGVEHDYCVTTVRTIPDAPFTVESVLACDVGIGGANTLAAPTTVAATDDEFDDKVTVSWEDPGETEDSYTVLRDGVEVATIEGGLTEFQDYDAEPGISYDYCVVAHSEWGGASLPVCDGGRRSHVVAPIDVSATDGAHETHVEIAWESASTTVILFEILRDGTGIKTVSGTARSFKDYEVDAGVDHDYCVRAYTALGQVSAPTCDTGRREIVAPTSVEASDEGYEDRVLVTWEDQSRVESGYKVYRKEAGISGDSLEVATRGPNRTSFVDETGAPGLDYQYSVFAFDSLGVSSAVSELGRRTLVPPASVTATIGEFEDKVVVSWEDRSYAETGYVVRRDGAAVGTTGANETSFEDFGITFGAAHDYTVASMDAYGESETVASFGTTAILAPGSLHASDVYEDEVVLVWTDESAIETGYEVFRDGVSIGTTGADVTSFADAGATVGTVHEYCVQSQSGIALSDLACDEGIRVSRPSGFTRELDEFIEDPTANEFGGAVAVDGDLAVIGSPNFGAEQPTASVYQRNAVTNTWSRVAILAHPAPTASDEYGSAVAINGNWILIGDYTDPEGQDFTFGAVYAFERTGSVWTYRQKIRPSDIGPGMFFGGSLDIDGDQAVLGIWEGSSVDRQNAYVFQLNNGVWTEEASLRSLVPTVERFGLAVAIDKNRVAVVDPRADGVAFRSGVAYVFSEAADVWTLEDTVFADDGHTSQLFGYSIDLRDDVLLAGSWDNAAGSQAGAAYAFRFDGSEWRQEAKLISSDIKANDLFSWRVALGSHEALIGSYAGGPDSNGAVYAFSHELDKGWQEVVQFVPADGSVSWEAAAIALDEETALISSKAPRRVYSVNWGVAAPSPVVASDDLTDNPIQIEWVDRSDKEEGYRIYRNGELIQTLDPDFETFNDFDADPGNIYTYSVTAFDSDAVLGESFPSSDYGRRPPDGNITGRVATRFGAGVDSVTLCLGSVPNQSLLFDGEGAQVRVFGATLPPHAMTVGFWMRSADASGAGTPISYAMAGQANTFTVRDYGNFIVDVNGETTGPTGISANDGEWHHIAVTRNSADGRIQLYKDGVLAFETTGIAVNQALPSGGRLIFGQEQDYLGGGFETAEAFLGQLDEVRVWNRALNVDEIRDVRTRVFLDSDQLDDLEHRWTFNYGRGSVAEDLGAAGQYAEIHGGVHWTEGVDELVHCLMNDVEGNYALSSLRYVDSEPITVTPVREGHIFEPAFKTITLSRQNPVENQVGFTDITQFSVAGTVRYEDTLCFAEGIEIYVDGVVAGFTEADGSFAVSMGRGDHVIEPRLANHAFEPSSLELRVEGSVAGKDFLDTTTRQLYGQVGGGCDLPIGRVQLAISNDCFDETIIETVRDYNWSLPPGQYFVRVVDVIDPPAILDRADILAYFDELGPQEVNLLDGDVRVDFLYRAPLAIVVEDLPDPICDEIIDPLRGIAVPGVPHLKQLDSATLKVRVYEDYGNGNVCPVDGATLTVFDEVIDKEGQPVSRTLNDGLAVYETKANTPNIFAGRVDAQGNDRSYQKSITFVVEVDGREPLQHTEWFLVTGDRPRSGTFVSATTEEIPLLILRDPPGDGSFASVAKGRTTSLSFSNIFTESVGAGIKNEIKAGVQFEQGSLFWATNTEAYAVANREIEFGVEGVQDDGFESSITTLETFSTSSDELFTGESADVILGAALNLVFAKSDVLEINEETCVVSRSETVRVGGAADQFATTYLYTRDHIKNVIIPQLQDLAVLDPSQAAYYNSAVANWNAQLVLADRLRDEALNSTGGDFPFGFWPPKENRSFSAGADRQFSQTMGSTDSFSWSVKAFTNVSAAIGYGFEVAGTGEDNLLEVNFGFSYERAETQTTENSFTVDYTLSDNDVGDYFSTDVAYDPKYGTPVFKPRSGRSSCPYEFHTQPRDSTIVGVEPPVLHDVDPNEPGVFTLSLTNASPSEEGREYVLLPIQTTNPGGAILKANGNSFGSGLSFFIGPEQTQEVTLTVERGPSRYFYEDIKLQLVSPCEYERWQAGGPLLLADTLSFSIDYAAPCTDIKLFEPKSGWTFNQDDALATNDTILVTLDDFVLQLSEEDEIEEVGAEFRRLDTDVWFPIGSVEKDSIPTFPNGDPKSVSLYWDVSGLNDGPFEIRAYSRCSVGRAFSLNSTGVIDREDPRPFGAPLPADATLSFGDEISITFNERIACSSVNPVNVTLEYADTDSTTAPVLVDLNCDGTSIVLTPTAPPLATLEGKVMTARVTGIKDLAGNRLESSTGGDEEVWSFEVSQSALAWKDSDVLHKGAFRSPGSFIATLTNGLGEDVDFSLSDVPSWLSPSVGGGSLISNDTRELEFTVDANLGLGTHVATLNAVVNNPPTVVPLEVRVEINCQPPVWTVNAEEFENSMTLVVQASIGGAVSQDPDDIVAAYVGTQLRGVGRTVYDASLDQWMTFLTVYSNRIAGENVRFRVYDASECLVYGATDKSFRFESESRVGEPIAPKVLIALDELPMADQHIDLNEGWTWFSVNLQNVDMSLLSMLGDLNPQPGDLIKSQTQFSQFDEQLGWIGSLDQLNTQESYIIKLSEAGTLVATGEPVVPDENPIAISDGWNWVSYLPQTSRDVATSLSSLVPTSGDAMLVKSQNGFSQYIEDTGTWSGSMNSMESGQGYRLYLDNAFASDNRLVYPNDSNRPMTVHGGGAIGAGAEGASAAAATTEAPTTETTMTATAATATTATATTSAWTGTGPEWKVEAHRYEHTMTVTGALEVDGASFRGDHRIGAFVGGELRGVAQLQHVPILDQKLFFLMVHSSEVEGETIEFRVFDPDRNRLFDVAETLAFKADGVVGTVSGPFEVSASADEAFGVPVAFSLSADFANPLRVADPVSFRYALPSPEYVSFKMYDAQGREVASLVQGEQQAGRHEVSFDPRQLHTGVYFYRMQAGDFKKTSKLVLLR